MRSDGTRSHKRHRLALYQIRGNSKSKHPKCLLPSKWLYRRLIYTANAHSVPKFSSFYNHAAANDEAGQRQERSDKTFSRLWPSFGKSRRPSATAGCKATLTLYLLPHDRDDVVKLAQVQGAPGYEKDSPHLLVSPRFCSSAPAVDKLHELR